MSRDKYWLVSRKATVRVITEDHRIVEAAPLVQRFKGQHIQNLFAWFRRTFGEFTLECEWDTDP